MSKVTIRDIAKEAGVSVATVSNVINGINKCRPDTKTKVQDAIKKLNYKQNISAKTLATRKSGLIGLIVPRNSRSNNLNHTNIFINGMNQALKNYNNYDLLVTEIFNESEELSTWIAKRDLEGIIFMGDYSEEVLKSIESLTIPSIMINNYNRELQNTSYIHSEDTMGAYLAVEYLVDKGSKNIAFVSRDIEEYEVDKRKLYGYITAIEEFGLHGSEENIIEVEESFESGYLSFKKLFQERKPDGIIFTCPHSAFGAIKYINKNNLTNESLNMIAFGELEMWEYLTPSISSIDEHSFNKGRLAVNTLLDKINNGGKFPKEQSISVSVIDRKDS